MSKIIHNSRIIADALKTKHAYLVRILENAIRCHKRTDFFTQQEEYRGSAFTVYVVSTELLCLTIFSSTNNKAKQLLVAKLGHIDNLLDALENFEIPDELPDMFIYAIKNEVTGNIKIGISRNPEERLKQLQTGNDCKLTLLTYFKAENRFEDETKIHLENAKSRVRGEWFSSVNLPRLTEK